MTTKQLALVAWRALFVLGRAALARGNTFHTYVVYDPEREDPAVQP